MAEILYIRLGSQASDSIAWLIASKNPDEIIASGELGNTDGLQSLSDKASQRDVVVFIPGCDVTLKSLKVPAKSQRAIRLAAPYMLEDTLAQDVEDLFFAYANLPTDPTGNNCFIAGVEKNQIDRWISWLADADIKADVMLPDYLAMPIQEANASAVQLNNQIILRKDQWEGYTVDTPMWDLVCNELRVSDMDEGEAPIKTTLEIYSDIAINEITQEHVQLSAMPEELPLALLAQHAEPAKFNLLQGEYKVSVSRPAWWKNWQWAAGFAVLALCLNMVNKGLQIYQLDAQQVQIEKEVISLYKKTFPKTKKIRINSIKSQLKGKMAGVNSGVQQGGFLVMLDKLRSAFASVPDMEPQTLKFDAKKQEVRIQALGKDYQVFDTFSQRVKGLNMKVSQGSQSNQGDKVSGSFSIQDSKGRS